MSFFTQLITMLLTLISQLQAPATAAPTPPPTVVARPAFVLRVPASIVEWVSPDGRLPDGTCPRDCAPANFYDATHRTVVLAPNQSARTIQHELCHAHQEEVVLEAFGREPRVDLVEWYQTEEGVRYASAYDAGLPDTFGTWYSERNALEDFANACAYYVLDRPLDTARFTLMEELLGAK